MGARIAAVLVPNLKPALVSLPLLVLLPLPDEDDPLFVPATLVLSSARGETVTEMDWRYVSLTFRDSNRC